MFTLEEGKESDADCICHIHTSSIRQICASHYDDKEIEIWAGTQTRETYIPCLKNKEIIIIKRGSTLAGFIHHIEHIEDGAIKLDCELSPKIIQIEIKRLFVDPGFIRRGLGKLLVQEVESLANEKGAECLTVSAALNAVGFYTKMGFQKIRRKPYQVAYQFSIDNMWMVKNLKKQKK